MTDIKADYLKYTAPDVKGPFIAALKKVPVFSRLTEVLISQLFDYAKFIYLEDKDQPVRNGQFGQNIYVLIHGTLEVFLEDQSGNEKQMDVIFRPFSVFGEQCLLGEAYNTTIESRGETLLLAIDMSVLPDIFGGWEHPDQLLDDQDYQPSLDLNTIIASVLMTRLNRLIKDQYKLVQKLVILHQSSEYRTSWRQNVLLTTIFNEFTQNQLSPLLKVDEILDETLALVRSSNERLDEMLRRLPVNTEKIYLELARLESLGKIDNVNLMLMEAIQRLTLKALELDEYTKGLELEPHNLPAIISLSEYLDEVYLTIIESGVLSGDMSKASFLEGFLNESYPDPGQLLSYVREHGLIDSVFRSSYLMLLISQTCLRKEYELNQLIARCVSYLTKLNTPRQNVTTMRQKFIEDNQSITTELIDLYNQTIQSSAERIKKRQPTDTGQDSVEELLSKYHL